MKDLKEWKIGFIGIGVMGKSMARNLRKAGYDVSVYTRTKTKALDLIEEGAKWYDSVSQLAQASDLVITMVGFPKDVEEVYFGASGILENLKVGGYCVDMTTTSPQLSLRIYQTALTKGIHALDAPVSGGDTGARNGTLAIMVGGDETNFETVRPLFEAMGNNIRYEGAASYGQHTKMANQIAVACNLAGTAEAIAYGQRVGLDLDKMLATITTGAAGSWQLSNNGPKMVSDDMDPGFYMKHFIKDMKIAVEEAQQRGLDIRTTESVLDSCNELADQGKEDLGTQALIQYYHQ